ncbi:MAG: AI-2E family transporter [Proteobacteria bacterium]|nr:MAG: AI-2E family transporter [Pseudomonadota bacterium]
MEKITLRPESSEPASSVKLIIPFTTYLKAIGVALLVAVGLKLVPLFFLLYFAILMAVTLDPAVLWLTRRKVPSGLALAMVSGLVILAVASFFYMVLPPLIAQAGLVAKQWPEIQAGILSKLSHETSNGPLGPLRRDLLEQVNQKSSGLPIPDILSHAVAIGGSALGGISEFVIFLILGIYFLAQGRVARDWILDFFSGQTREKLKQTCVESGQVVFAYVAGQVITSLLVVVFAFTLFTILKVPAALMLAIVAGVFDILPIVGFFLSVGPAVLLALTVSGKTALIVVIAYFVYHQIESYVIAPWIYGSRMKLSSLVVLLAVLAGGMLGGVFGAIAILPIVAIYPLIERIWFKDYLGEDVIRRHQKLEHSKEEARVGPKDSAIP